MTTSPTTPAVVTVPVEPTDAMIEAGNDAHAEGGWNDGSSPRATYKAMLAASVPQTVEGGEPGAWRWRVKGLSHWVYVDSKPTFSAAQPGEVYDLEPLSHYRVATPPAETKGGVSEDHEWLRDFIKQGRLALAVLETATTDRAVASAKIMRSMLKDLEDGFFNPSRQALASGSTKDQGGAT